MWNEYYAKLCTDQPPATVLIFIFLVFCDMYCLATQKN